MEAYLDRLGDSGEGWLNIIDKVILDMGCPIIHIVGLPGAGKTTLAKLLSQKLKIPIYGIGFYRKKFPMTPIGEADAWLALFKDLSKLGWSNCILETTGLNAREGFLTGALPFDRMTVIKLEASRKTLLERVERKKKSEQGGRWLYSQYEDKYQFVKEMYSRFKRICAHMVIKTDRMTKEEVFGEALKRIKGFIE